MHYFVRMQKSALDILNPQSTTRKASSYSSNLKAVCICSLWCWILSKIGFCDQCMIWCDLIFAKYSLYLISFLSFFFVTFSLLVCFLDLLDEVLCFLYNCYRVWFYTFINDPISVKPDFSKKNTPHLTWLSSPSYRMPHSLPKQL
ncbi:hypothetical protein E1A91_D02G152900v1 [Gossypium mustelinum]|uniref:Uncharacterized protein n=1 Tax=Gossypium mustelinum TaxID=34275 RepID=A0A5D2VWX5_GOSMU|nr:hypothetical protein E1A91_D02G152900v1 [Gossypium mustelinum]